MRCPKCRYLSFEPEPRCRNCGYDLSFEPGDVVVKASGPAEEVLPDLELRLREAEALASSPVLDPVFNQDRVHEDAVAPSVAPNPTPAPTPTTELPLFVQGLASEKRPDPKPAAPISATPEELAELVAHLQPREPRKVAASVDPAPAQAHADADFDELDVPDLPLVKLPASPRVPLSVRRPTPAPGRVREKYQSAQRSESTRQIGLLERDLLDSADTPWPLIPPDAAPAEPDLSAALPSGDADFAESESVGAGPRLQAALVDVLFIGSINATIVWLTLQSLELTVSQIASLPVLPVAALLFLLNTLYLLMFTGTNGQTVGKMAAGIRVVGTSADAHDRVTFKQAMLRAVLTFPSVLMLGAGFVPALVGNGLALHDRFSHTRVVRA